MFRSLSEQLRATAVIKALCFSFSFFQFYCCRTWLLDEASPFFPPTTDATTARIKFLSIDRQLVSYNQWWSWSHRLKLCESTVQFLAYCFKSCFFALLHNIKHQWIINHNPFLLKKLNRDRFGCVGKSVSL